MLATIMYDLNCLGYSAASMWVIHWGSSGCGYLWVSQHTATTRAVQWNVFVKQNHWSNCNSDVESVCKLVVSHQLERPHNATMQYIGILHCITLTSAVHKTEGGCVEWEWDWYAVEWTAYTIKNMTITVNHAVIQCLVMQGQTLQLIYKTSYYQRNYAVLLFSYERQGTTSKYKHTSLVVY